MIIIKDVALCAMLKHIILKGKTLEKISGMICAVTVIIVSLYA